MGSGALTLGRGQIDSGGVPRYDGGMSEDDLKAELERARSQLVMLYEISNAMRTTLKLEEILYIILTAATSHAGLGFNRAMLFLVNENARRLEGRLGIGPGSGEEAQAIWSFIDAQRSTLDDLIAAYHTARQQPPTPFNRLVQSITIPLTDQGGVVALTALEGMPLEITTPEARARLPHDPHTEPLQLEEFVTVPLKAKDRVVGVLVADHRFTKKPITKEDVRLLTMFANQAGLAIENSRLYEQTLASARTDALTGLWNHGYFQTALSEEIQRAARYRKGLSLAILDIDHFKHYNDTLGHQAGDAVLRGLAKMLKEAARAADTMARYGGEEFAMIFPDTSRQEALGACERLRERVFQEPFTREEIQPAGRLTISIGLAGFPHDADTPAGLIRAADLALYEAKRTGKNRVCLAHPLHEELRLPTIPHDDP